MRHWPTVINGSLARLRLYGQALRSVPSWMVLPMRTPTLSQTGSLTRSPTQVLMSGWSTGRLVLMLPLLMPLLGTGCIKAPNTLYLVDEKTALEQQATGSFGSLETELSGALLNPAPEQLLTSEIGQGQRSEAAELASLSSIYSIELTEQERLNLLLVRSCVGEGLDGLLAQTPNTCRGAVEVGDVVKLVQRVNRNRKQLFAWMLAQQPTLDEKTLIQRWRQAHLKGVVCGGQIQLESGQWGQKAC